MDCQNAGFCQGPVTGEPPRLKRRGTEMRNRKNVGAAVCLMAVCLMGSSVEGGLFGRGGTRAQRNPVYVSPHQSHVPRTRMGQRMLARQDDRDSRTAQRTGRSFDDVRQQRIQRLTTLGTIIGGLGDGLGGVADGMSYSAPSTVSPGRSPGGLPSNFSGRMQMNSFNRSYSTNPWHAPVR